MSAAPPVMWIATFIWLSSTHRLRWGLSDMPASESSESSASIGMRIELPKSDGKLLTRLSSRGSASANVGRSCADACQSFLRRPSHVVGIVRGNGGRSPAVT